MRLVRYILVIVCLGDGGPFNGDASLNGGLQPAARPSHLQSTASGAPKAVVPNSGATLAAVAVLVLPSQRRLLPPSQPAAAQPFQRLP
ncbi:hypothetical protein DEO72_LG4g1050 [Vigna unguiculata]|uniref:Uncharacterized protein n=1 Tax=Vigna unguiculata TaxID=3917 RepID=A0A4D6LPL0_VIGUN|nr:hypothetical protein DEO72_LG4g1050 [Vigna unguiculata]